jgi:hypothetical protein
MPHDLSGLVMHGHHTVSMAQRDAAGKFRMFGNKRRKHGLIAVQNHIHCGMLRHGISQAGNNGCRPAIATHGVNGYDDALKFRGRR